MLIFKNSFRKIWKSKGRFLSLILIVILGTSFFAGVRETASDMIKTLDNYYDETNLYDFKIVSTMGLTDDDIKSLEEIDGIERIEGTYSFDTLIDGKAVVELLRNGEKMTLSFPLKEIEVQEYNGQKSKRPMLGIKSVSTIEVEQLNLSLSEAFYEALLETWDVTEATLRGVGQMITGQRGSEDLGGIVRIAEMSGDITKQSGFLDFLVFMCLLSINLGLINLFPIPVLDGGHVVIYLVEIFTRKEINTKVKDTLFKLGFSLIIALMVFATWNDMVRLFHRWFA